MGEVINRARANAQSWYTFFKIPLASCLSERDVYHYNGASAWEDVNNYFINTKNKYDFRKLSGRGFPFDNFYDVSAVTFVRQEIINVKNIIECATHFEVPIYINFLKGLYNNIIGGLTKGTIDVKISIDDKSVEKAFVSLEKTNKLKTLDDLIQKTQLLQEQDENAQILMQGLTSERKKLELQYEIEVERPVRKRDLEEQIVADKIRNIIDNILSQEENKENLMALIDSFFSTGFAVIELLVCDDGHFDIYNIERPEMCFFSPTARKKDKSDGRYCGKLKVMDRKQIQYIYDLSEKEAEGLQDFPALPVPSSMGMSGNPLQFFFGFGIIDEQRKSFLLLCDFYERDEDGSIHKYVLCGNKILEHQILKDFENFPLVFFDSSSVDTRGQTSIFSHAFSVQKDLAVLLSKRAGLSMNIIGGKLLLPTVDSMTRESIDKNYHLDKPVLIVNVSAGNNDVIQPQIIPNTDLPQGLLLEIESSLNRLRFLVNDIMSSNTTKNSDAFAVVSGVALENANLNQNNLFNKYLNIVTSNLNKMFKNTVMPYIYNCIKKEKGVGGYMAQFINKANFKEIVECLRLEISILTDNAVVRHRNKTFLENILNTLVSKDQDPQLISVFMRELIKNTELPNKGKVIEKIEEIEEKKASQPAQPDPVTQIEQQKLELAKMDIDRKSQFEQSKLMLEKQKIETDAQLELLKIKIEKDRHDLDSHVRVFDAELRYHEVLTNSQIDQAMEGVRKIDDLSKEKQ